MSGWQGGAYDERSLEHRARDYRVLRWYEGIEDPEDRPSRDEVYSAGFRIVPMEWMAYMERVRVEAEAFARRLACNHDDDPECSRCESMGPLRRALAGYHPDMINRRDGDRGVRP